MLVERRRRALATLSVLRQQTLHEVGRPFTHEELIEARDAGKR